jgi:uncharacterized protein
VKFKTLNQTGIKTFALIFDTGDEVVSGLVQFAKQNGLGGSHFTAIGAFRDVTLGYFEWDRKKYKHIAVDEQVEVLSLAGDIALEDGEPQLHAHVVVGTSDGSARGGHLIKGHVRPTLEVILSEEPQSMVRKFDPASGLALIQV